MRTTRRRRPQAVLTSVVMIVVGLGGLLLQSSPAVADVNRVVGNAYGLQANVLGLVNIPPTPTVSLDANEASPPAAFGPFTDSLVGIGPTPPLLNLLSTGV